MGTRNRNRARPGRSLEEAILEFVNREGYEPIPQRQLIHAMRIRPEDRPPFRRTVRMLLDEEKLVKLSRGRLAPPREPAVITGPLKLHPRGFGFVPADDGGEDVFIAPPFVGNRITGDTVEVEILRERPDGRRDGRIVRTVERRSRELLGVFRKAGRGGGRVQPFDPSIGEAIQVDAPTREPLRDGEIVLVDLKKTGGRERLPRGEILERLGRLGEPGTDTRIIIRKFRLADRFPDEVIQAAERLPSRIPAKEAARRERFDDPAPVTIDGETAKDFDDAIAVARLKGGGFRLWVHIADVAHFVRPGSVLDQEARKRGTSVYFPRLVLPMFPENLSNNLCSLRPGVDRLVQSVIIDLGPRGGVKSVRFADGVIRSAGRLTYAQVHEVLEGGKRVKGVPEKVVPMLLTAGKLREVLERRRHARGSVDFDLPEPQILLDIEGEMTGITITPRNQAHRLIEEFMLLANEVVAGRLEEEDWPCLYRIHEKPDPERIELLASFVSQFGLELKTRRGEILPGAIGEVLEQVEGKPEHDLISQVALRSMKQAKYHPVNEGHFGLGAPVYCHFTSPIRRYPDLVVHRLLRACRRDKAKPPAWADGLGSTAADCSELERNAEAAERDFLLRKKLAFVKDHVGDTFDGIITGVTSFGVFVQLVESTVEGLLRVSQETDEPYRFNPGRMELLGERTGRRFRLGDRLPVTIAAVDMILQRADFTLPAHI